MLYPWATKDYLLWEMSLAQVILYMNEGIDQKYPKTTGNGEENKLANKSHSELKKLRDEIRATYGAIDGGS